MAKYEIKHTCCGSITTAQIYGKVAERDRKAEWLASQPCAECRAKAAKAANDAATAAAKAAGLPDLTGSDKQVSWAEGLRAKVLADVAAGKWAIDSIVHAAMMEIGKDRLAPLAGKLIYADAVRAIADIVVRRTTSAAAWIDGRGTAAGVAAEAVKAAAKEYLEGRLAAL